MRSGQYKLSCSRNSDAKTHKGILIGHFKPHCSKDLPPLTAPALSERVAEAEFPHCNSLLITASKLEGGRASHHRSCENVSRSKGAVNRVEQKVRSFLHRNESKARVVPTSSFGEIVIASPLSTASQNVNANLADDGWQVGKIVTMSRRPRLTSALSHSALHTLTSDTASCLSASSGYSSSSSSSCYGSFKSSGSIGSTLPRHREIYRCHSPQSKQIFLVDNPLYDLTPGSLLPKTLTHNYPHFEESNVDELTNGFSQDPIAMECREYFEKRMQSSETLRKRWSSYKTIPESSPCSEDSEEQYLDSLEDISSLQQTPSKADEFQGTSSEQEVKKFPLDEKMEFLRNEITSLMHQDNTLFKQLLALHDSISSLKAQNANRAQSPSSFDSFTEEEEDEDDDEDDEEVDEENKNKRKESMGSSLPLPKIHDAEEEEDEGHCTDLSLNHSPSQSPSPASTWSSTSSKDSLSRCLTERDFSIPNNETRLTRCRKSYAPNARNRRRASSVHQSRSPMPPLTGDPATASVVVHGNDELSLLHRTRPRANTHGDLPVYEPNSHLLKSLVESSEQKMTTGKNKNSQPSPSCSSSCGVLGSHPPYREALIM